MYDKLMPSMPTRFRQLVGMKSHLFLKWDVTLLLWCMLAASGGACMLNKVEFYAPSADRSTAECSTKGQGTQKF